MWADRDPAAVEGTDCRSADPTRLEPRLQSGDLGVVLLDAEGEPGLRPGERVVGAGAPELRPRDEDVFVADRGGDLEAMFLYFGFRTASLRKNPWSVREQYKKAVAGLKVVEGNMRAAGRTPEQMARVLLSARRNLGKYLKNKAPYLVRQSRRGLGLYSWDDIVESATRPGGGDLGL